MPLSESKKKMPECNFCRSLATYRNLDALPRYSDFKSEYAAALVQRTWNPKWQSKRYALKTVIYRRCGYGFKLNFCPECGRELRGSNE